MIGDKISHYRIVAVLGSGGMGVVYRALDENLGRDVAIKVLHQEVMHDSDRLARFGREAQAVASLAHPNILAIHDFGFTGGVAYAVTELLVGETLRQRLAREHLHWRKALSIATSVAEGLAAAHAKGIVHQDIKPENIFLTADGRVKILDFGVARIGLPPVTDPMTATLTFPPLKGGSVMGTIGYMAPEQLRGETTDARSDIFALGCVLYEMLAGRRAFSGDTFALTVTALLMDPSPEVDCPGIAAPRELNSIVARCLEKNTGERFQSASDLAFALRSLLTEKHAVPAYAAESPSHSVPGLPGYDTQAVGPPPARNARAGRRLPGWAVVAVLFVCALAFAVWFQNKAPGEVALVVLPFENAVSDRGDLADSVAERFNMSIGELGIVKVKPLPFRQAFDGKELDFRALAEKLGVAALLKGRIRQIEQNIEMYMELIDGRDGNVMWHYSGVENRTRAMEVVARIARSVVEKLRPKLGSAEVDRLDCLVLYGKGRDELDKRNRNSFKLAIRHFEDALQKNPNFALAYVGLADCHNLLGIYGEDAPGDVFPKGKQAAEKALELDESLAEAHTCLAFALERHELSRAASQQQYSIAIELASSKRDALAAAHHRYGVHLLGLGRFSEAIEQLRLAQAANPFSQIIMADLAQPYLLGGNLDEAIRICDRTIEKYPASAPAYRYRGLALEQKREFARAIADLEMAVKLSGNSPLMRGELGHVLASAGMKDRALSTLAELLERRRNGYSSCYRIAQIYACLGDREKALRYLDQAIEDRDPSLWYLVVDPIFRNKLRDEPHFQQLKEFMESR